MISVAAELAEMHPQTLRMYEARGLITPKRSPKNTRLYSQEDVERLRRIQEMTAEQGLNLAGVETVLELEEKLERMRAELRRMQARAGEMEQQMVAEIERARRSLGAEIVPYGAYESEALQAAAATTRGRRRQRLDPDRAPAPQQLTVDAAGSAADQLPPIRSTSPMPEPIDGCPSVRTAMAMCLSPAFSSAAWWTSCPLSVGRQPPLNRTFHRAGATAGMPQLCSATIEPSSPLREAPVPAGEGLVEVVEEQRHIGGRDPGETPADLVLEVGHAGALGDRHQPLRADPAEDRGRGVVVGVGDHRSQRRRGCRV